jgi:nicotinate-nucleotide adenylyltransferase
MRIGILGGSFDPVHIGHLALAHACQEQAALDEVWFTPAATQPLKHAGPHASDADRIEMLRLAIAGEPRWKICELELDRGGLSYSVDTLRTIRAGSPGDGLFFLMGADTLADVPHWKQPADVFRLATPLVVRRAGQPPPDLSVLAGFCTKQNRPRLIEMPAVDVSSTEIRRRAAAGEPIDELVPPTVASYINGRGVYR